jgi:hypothetical protein
MASKRRVATSVALAFPLAALVACVTTTPPAGGPDDAGPFDSAATGPGDSGAPDSSVVPLPDSASTCVPANVQAYHPTWVPPKQPESACTLDQINSYGDCIDSGSPQSSACAPWYGVDAASPSACISCLADSKATDAAWGPIVDVGTSGSDRQINVSGCMAIILSDNGSGCAGSVQALEECESAACADNCEGASATALAQCIEQADGTGCDNYLSPATCVYDAGAGALACLGPAQGTFGQKFAAVAKVFCLETDGG